MASRFDPNFTSNVINSMGPKTAPRLRQLMTGLVQHVHDFARENELTVDEWMAGVQLINWAGRMSDAKRNEGQLLCDVIGLESYYSLFFSFFFFFLLHYPICPSRTVANRTQSRGRNNIQTRG